MADHPNEIIHGQICRQTRSESPKGTVNLFAAQTSQKVLIRVSKHLKSKNRDAGSTRVQVIGKALGWGTNQNISTEMGIVLQ